MRKTLILFLVFSLLLLYMGCAEWSRTQKGGALPGAAMGGATGAYIGNYMDKQAAEIERDIAGARVERVGQGR